MNFHALHDIIGSMDELLSGVRRFVRRHGLLETGTVLVVGVSGGPDSLCLLHLLQRLAAEMRLHLHVAHLNHGLRAAEADADAAFVADLAAQWGLPCSLGRADVAALAEASGLSVEEAARHARYRFLAQVARSGGAQTIAVGHNLDDQAETVLMHFLRGSGVAGLRGMLPKARLAEYRLSVAGADDPAGERGGNLLDPPVGPPARRPARPDSLWLVRPLLATPRPAIEAYCAANGLRPRFDRSNEDTTFFRNRLRHELLPVLATYNPQIRQTLAHTADVLAADHELLRAELESIWDQVVPVASAAADAAAGQRAVAAAEIWFDLAGWRALPLSLQRATVREAIHRLRFSLRNINWEHVERAVWLAREGRTGQRATLAAGLELRIGYAALRIADEGAAWDADLPQVAGPVVLSAPGATRLPDGWCIEVRCLRVDELPPDFDANPDPWIAYLDAEAVGPRLVVRPRLPGEVFQPHGLGGHRARLAEFMINARAPRDARAAWPILAGRQGAAWVCGLRLAEHAAVRTATTAIWRVQFTRTSLDAVVAE